MGVADFKKKFAPTTTEGEQQTIPTSVQSGSAVERFRAQRAPAPAAPPEVSQPKKGILSRAFGTLEKAGGLVEKFGEAFVSPTARALTTPFVETYRAVTGTKGSVKTPFGEVKPISEMGQKEKIFSIIDVVGLLPVGKTVKVAVAAKAKRALPAVAETLSGVSATKLKFAADPENVAAMDKALKAVESDEALAMFGKETFDAAKNQIQQAQKAWAGREMKLVETLGENVTGFSKKFKKGMTEVLQSEGVKVSGKHKINLSKSKFARNTQAQSVFSDLMSIAAEPVNSAIEVLNKRPAMTAILQEIPKESVNIRRVAESMVKNFDDVLDASLGGEAKVMRKAYTEAVGPAREIANKMTDSDGVFSMDKAASFVRQAASDVKFDNAQLLKKLDSISGTQFSKDAKALGVAKAIEKVDPQTRGRVFDVLTTYGIAKVPVLSAFVSPKFWGSVMRHEAKASTKQADAFKWFVLQQLLTKPFTSSASSDEK